MSKIYDLYPSYERKIDNYRRRILGYEKMKRDMQRQIQILKNTNKKQKEIIDKIKDLLIIKKSRCLNEDDYILNVLDLDEILNILKEK